jgi:hypothetical protein
VERLAIEFAGEVGGGEAGDRLTLLVYDADRDCVLGARRLLRGTMKCQE